MPSTIRKAGSAAEKEVVQKKSLYRDMTKNYHFNVFANDTMGPWCNERKVLIEKLESMLNEMTGDQKINKSIVVNI